MDLLPSLWLLQEPRPDLLQNILVPPGRLEGFRKTCTAWFSSLLTHTKLSNGNLLFLNSLPHEQHERLLHIHSFDHVFHLTDRKKPKKAKTKPCPREQAGKLSSACTLVTQRLIYTLEASVPSSTSHFHSSCFRLSVWIPAFI